MKKRHVAFVLTSLMMLAGCSEGKVSENKPTEAPAVTDKVTEGVTTDKITSTETPVTTEKFDELANLREQAIAYLDSIDTSLYREKERTELEATIATMKTAIDAPDATAESIQAAIESFKAYLNTLKTDAEYIKEEQEAFNQAIKEAREKKIKEATISDINQYRKEERKTALALQTEEIKKIDALTTKEEIESYSLAAYQAEVKKLRTNADYTMDEMVNYHYYPSKWPLVNEHGYTYTREGDHVKTKEIGYIFDSLNTYSDVTFTFTVDAPADTGATGILLATNSDYNDGITGYLINITCDSTKGHQYLQVYNVENAYGSYDPKSKSRLDYIDGWEYEKTGGKVLGTTFRIAKEGSTIKMYDEKQYQENPDSATVMTADLTKHGFPVHNDLHFGIINWDGRDANIALNSIVTPDDNIIDGVKTAKFYADKYLETVDQSIYREAEKASLVAKMKELTDLYVAENVTYQAIIDKLNELKTFIPTLKTAAQYQAEEDAKNLTKVKELKINSMFYYNENSYSAETAPKVLAIYNEAKDAVNALTSIEAVNAFDFTPYQTRINALGDNVTDFYKEMKETPTQSSWDLIQQHAAQWQYDDHKLTVNSVAWQMGKSNYSDFDIVLNFNSASQFNAGADFRSIIVRGRPNEAHPDAMSGYVINFCNMGDAQYVQIFYLEYFWGYTNGNFQYLGGLVSKTPVNDTTYRVSFVGNTCSIYYENEYKKGEENVPAAVADLSAGNTLPVYTSGKLGGVCWAADPNNCPAADFNITSITRR